MFVYKQKPLTIKIDYWRQVHLCVSFQFRSFVWKNKRFDLIILLKKCLRRRQKWPNRSILPFSKQINFILHKKYISWPFLRYFDELAFTNVDIVLNRNNYFKRDNKDVIQEITLILFIYFYFRFSKDDFSIKENNWILVRWCHAVVVNHQHCSRYKWRQGFPLYFVSR